MKIATYNIWNHPMRWEERIEAICAEVKRVAPDVIAFQEVKANINGEAGIDVAQHIADQIEYPFYVFHAYPDSPDEGLAFLSKVPFETTGAIWHSSSDESNYCATRVTFHVGDHTVGMTNVHLNWRSPMIREAQVQAVREWIGEGERYEILCGDFNDDPQSEIYCYLTGHRWIDVATCHCGGDEPTLDYIHNPYLKQDSLLKQPSRYDWIFLRHDEGSAPLILNVDVFGKTPVTNAGVLPSDHYGVLLDIDMT